MVSDDANPGRDARNLLRVPLANFRDLGGMRVAGGRIRDGRLWRSDDASLIPRAQAADLVARGLGAVLDLRSAREQQITGRGALEEFPVEYHHLPLTQTAHLPDELAQALRNGPNTIAVGNWYASVVARNGERLARGMEIIAGAEGAVLFHCSAGKDRTGIFAASLLTILGATIEAIVDDYMATADRMPEVRARLRRAYAARGSGRREAEAPVLIDVQPINLDTMFQRFEPDGIGEFVRLSGLGDATRARLRERLIDAEEERTHVR